MSCIRPATVDSCVSWTSSNSSSCICTRRLYKPLSTGVLY